jgi:hypothetical protein
LQSLTIDPANPSIRGNGQQQFTATGAFSDGSTQDVTNAVAWSSSAPDIVAIDKNGLASAQPVSGTATVTATDTNSGVTASTNVTVDGPVLQAITISPDNPSIVGQQQQQFSATATFSDGSSQDVTRAVAWNSTAPDIVSIDNNGLASVQGVGTATLTATDTKSGVTASTTITCQPTAEPWRGSRGLTSKERSLAKSVYQDSIDYDEVAIEAGSIGSAGSTRTGGNTIYMLDNEFADNTSELTADGLNTLIHELGHVWQYQHGGVAYIPDALGSQFKAWLETGDRNNAYKWRDAVKQHLNWEDWNAEQQAEAMEDYFKAKQRIDAGKPEPDDQDTVTTLEPYVGKVRGGQGAPHFTPTGPVDPWTGM